MPGIEAAWLETLLEKKAMEKRVARVLRMEANKALGPGENYLSDIVRIKLDVVLGSGRTTRKSLIVKRKTENTFVVDTYNIFEHETQMYSEMLPQMEYLMDDFNDRRDYLWAEYYGATDDMIVFQDLKPEGFVLGDRHEGLDLEHSLMVMMSLARFHALGVALVSRGKLNAQRLPIHILARNDKITNKFYKGGIQTLAQTMYDTWGPKWKNTSQKLRSIGETLGDQIQELYKLDDSSFKVINHGDCWVNNMLFKYEPGTKRPEAMRFVDFQCCHYNSYGWDLIYFLYSSTQPSARHHHMAELLDAYHGTLTSSLGLYGCRQDNVPTREDMDREAERLQLVGLMVAATLAPITMADPKDAMEIGKMEDKSVEVAQNQGMYLNERYKAAVQQDLEDFMNKGIL